MKARMMAGGRRTASIALAVAGVLALAVLGAMAGGAGEAQGSSLSRGPAGWLAARRYLEARGAKVTIWREPLNRFSGGGVLVVTFPWQHGASFDAADPIESHLQRGGDVVLAWSGGQGNMGEMLVLAGLGLEPDEVRKPPIGPLGWRKFIRKEWDLRPEPGGARDLRIWAPRHMPGLPRPAPPAEPAEPGKRGESAERAELSKPAEGARRAEPSKLAEPAEPAELPEFPEGTEVLYRTPSGRPAVVRLPRHRGSLWLLPADALANARLGKAGNADLLETLLARLGPRWTFDEYHHGLVAAETAEDRTFLRSLDLVLLHLALLYVLAALTLSRRFGPAWSEPPVVTGSVGSFLLGLGALHHRLDHHGAAARRLLERARELFPDLSIPEDLARRADQGSATGPRDFVELARSLVELRRGGRRTAPSPSPDSAQASGDRK